MKKILYIITRLEKTGPNRVLENMITGINRKKCKIIVLSLFDSKGEFKKQSGVEYITLGLKGNIGALLQVKKIVKKYEKDIQPDIVHSHGIMPDFFNVFFENAYRITTLHCNIFEDYHYAHSYLKAFLMIKFHLFSLKKLDKVVYCSESVLRDMSKSKLNNMTYVNNGITTDNVKPTSVIRDDLGIKDKDFVYIYVGALSKRKNVQLLVMLFLQELKKNEHLIILGDGEYKESIIEQCKDYKNIHVLGFCSNVEDYLSESNVYVSDSLSEGLSISVIEALSKGLLIFLSDINSHKVFFNKDNTYIGETFNETNFNKKINNIRKNTLNTNKEKIIEYKENYFSDKSMMGEYEKIYEKQ